MKPQLKKAFTLVELIVVVTILSILSTIGFVSYSSYLTGVRDTNRISQLKAIGDALYMYSTTKSLPIPDDKIDIKSGDDIISYQGYVGEEVIETITYTSDGKDPKDDTYFSYYLTKDRKYFQLMAFLEEENAESVAYNKVINYTSAEIDYENRYPHTQGRKLGIITTETNKPIQETGITEIDVEDVGTENIYKSYLKANEVIEGNGDILSSLVSIAKVGGRGYSVDDSGELVYKDLDGDNSTSSSNESSNESSDEINNDSNTESNNDNNEDNNSNDSSDSSSDNGDESTNNESDSDTNLDGSSNNEDNSTDNKKTYFWKEEKAEIGSSASSGFLGKTVGTHGHTHHNGYYSQTWSEGNATPDDCTESNLGYQYGVGSGICSSFNGTNCSHDIGNMDDSKRVVKSDSSGEYLKGTNNNKPIFFLYTCVYE